MDASDWIKGIFFSVVASVIGAASKLAIRKSWLMEEEAREEVRAGSYRHPNLAYTAEVEDGLMHRHNPNEALLGIQEASDDENNNGSPQSPVEVDDQTLLLGESTPLLLRAHRQVETCCRERCFCDGLFGWCSCCTLAWFLRFSGMVGMSLLNPSCCLLAMRYATPSILAPFSGLTLVWVIVFSKPLVGEEPSVEQKVASALIVTGEIMVAIFGDHTNADGATRESIEASYKEAPFLAYFLGLTIYMAFVTVWIRSRDVSPFLRRFSWGTSGGALTGLAQCFIKDSLVIIQNTENVLGDPLHAIPWCFPLFILLAITFCFAGLLCLTATMKRYDATYSAAMFVGSFVVSTTLMSVAHYHTFHNLHALVDIIMYPSGVGVLILGVAVLVYSTPSTPAAREYPGTNEEDENRQPLTAAADAAEEPLRISYEPIDDGDESSAATESNLATDDLELTRSESQDQED